jgi:hypothetical protein
MEGSARRTPVDHSAAIYYMVGCLDSLLSQSDKGRALWSHTLYRLHDCLEPHGIEVLDQILNQFVIEHPSIRRF